MHDDRRLAALVRQANGNGFLFSEAYETPPATVRKAGTRDLVPRKSKLGRVLRRIEALDEKSLEKLIFAVDNSPKLS